MIVIVLQGNVAKAQMDNWAIPELKHARVPVLVYADAPVTRLPEVANVIQVKNCDDFGQDLATRLKQLM
jgi:hypothetical protein